MTKRKKDLRGDRQRRLYRFNVAVVLLSLHGLMKSGLVQGPEIDEQRCKEIVDNGILEGFIPPAGEALDRLMTDVLHGGDSVAQCN